MLNVGAEGRNQLAARSEDQLPSVAWPAGGGPFERLVKQRGRRKHGEQVPVDIAE